MRQVFHTLDGERKVGPAKQLGAYDLLQLLDAVAHRAGRDAEFFCSLRDAAQTRQRLKSQQALNRGDAGDGHDMIVAVGGLNALRRIPAL